MDSAVKTSMNVLKRQTTVILKQIAPTQREATTVLATLDLREMESSAKVKY